MLTSIQACYLTNAKLSKSSPFLFPLTTEGLNGLMQNEIVSGMFQPLKVSNEVKFNLL